jgi:hypothetical protein
VLSLYPAAENLKHRGKGLCYLTNEFEVLGFSEAVSRTKEKPESGGIFVRGFVTLRIAHPLLQRLEDFCTSI